MHPHIRVVTAPALGLGLHAPTRRRGQMRRFAICLALVLSTPWTAGAATFSFLTDPFAGTNVLNTPGQQIVGGEVFISFNAVTDVFEFDQATFGVGDQVLFASGLAGYLPSSGVNVVVLQSLDDDDISGTPFGAGSAANLIAAQVTTSGPGFFIYFNQGLDLPRLVFSTDLSDSNADLKILARMLNLAGRPEALTDFKGANFSIVPEPSTLLLVAISGCVSLCVRRERQARSAANSRSRGALRELGHALEDSVA